VLAIVLGGQTLRFWVDAKARAKRRGAHGSIDE